MSADVAPDRALEHGGSSTGLFSLEQTRTLGAYLRELWTRRDFAIALAQNDLRVKHLNSVLGQLWQLLNPALTIFVYFLIFGLVLGGRDGVDNYVTFLVTGVITFRFVQGIISGSARSVPLNVGLIRSIQFPRSVLPISVMLQQVLALLPALALVIGVAIVDGADISWRLLLLPGVVAVGAALGLGLGLIAARVGAVVNDLSQLLPHLFRILLYLSGILFSVATIDSEWVRDMFVLNPFYCLVTLARWSVAAEPFDGGMAASLAAWTVASIVVGTAVFRRAEYRFGA